MKSNWTSRVVMAFAIVIGGLVNTTATATIIYDVNFDGSAIDLSGFIAVNAFGIYSPNDFDATLEDYSITASNNGLSVFVFTLANSTWGGSDGLGGLNGEDVSIMVSALGIVLAAPEGIPNFNTNLFLVADAVTNGARENLTLAQDLLRYRTPDPPNDSIFETVPTNFVLARARADVPAPSIVALFGLALIGLGWSRRLRT